MKRLNIILTKTVKGFFVKQFKYSMQQENSSLRRYPKNNFNNILKYRFVP